MTGHLLNLGSAEYGTVFGNLFVFVAHILLVFVFFGLFVFQTTRNSLLGLLAMIFGVIGNVIVVSVVFVEIASASLGNLDEVFNTPVTSAISTYGPLLFVIGIILLGVSIVLNKEFPAYSGYLLLIGTIVFAASSAFPEYQLGIELIGSILTGIGFISIGVSSLKSLKKEILITDQKGI